MPSHINFSLQHPFSPRTFAGALRIIALTNLVVAQPLYEAISNSIGFFAARAEGSDLVLGVVTVSFALPGTLVLLEWAAGRIHPGLGEAVHCSSIGLLVGCFFLQVFSRLSDLIWFLLPLTVLSSGALLGIYYGVSWGRSFFTFLAPAIIVVPCNFLLDEGISRDCLAR